MAPPMTCDRCVARAAIETKVRDAGGQIAGRLRPGDLADGRIVAVREAMIDASQAHRRQLEGDTGTHDEQEHATRDEREVASPGRGSGSEARWDEVVAKGESSSASEGSGVLRCRHQLDAIRAGMRDGGQAH